MQAVRERLLKAIALMGHMPLDLVAADVIESGNPDTVGRHIERSDYLVVAIGTEAGSADIPVRTMEDVVDVALQCRVPVVALLFGGEAPQTTTDSHGAGVILAKIREHVGGMIQRIDVPTQATQALTEFIDTHQRPGWVSTRELPGADVATELARLSKENAELKEKLAALAEPEAQREARWDAVVRALEENKVLIPVWNKVATVWEQPVEMNLYTFFIRVGPQLAVELSASDAVEFIPTGVCQLESRDARAPWVVPLHSLNLWLTDLMALQLVRPSRRKRQAKDANQYWRLTREGRAFLSYVRRSALYVGGHRHVGFTSEFPIVTDFEEGQD
jgi:hypothetical protein